MKHAGPAADPQRVLADIQRIATVIRANPRDPGAWRTLGDHYLALGQFPDAEQAFSAALANAPEDAAAWHGFATACDGMGDTRRALEGYRRASMYAPTRLESRFAYASALSADAQHEAAETVARDALADGDDAIGHFVLGSILFAMGRPADAAAAFAASIERRPDFAPAHYNHALALDDAGDWAAAAAACERAFVLDGTQYAALAQLVYLKRRLCDWRDLDRWSKQLRDAVAARKPGITPFSFLAEPATPAEQRLCAETFASQFVTTPIARPARGARQARVGFVSSGFNNHPTALLTVDLFERLKRGAFETVGIATTPDDGGALRARIARAFDRFVELPAGTAAARAAFLAGLDLDMLVDLRGHGGGSIADVLAHRPAPIQVNWLAYPGTSGAAYIDYLIADPYVVPPAQRAHYSESLVRMPHAFQPSDTTRRIGAAPSRRDCGLPDRGVVFASFNNGYKITPAVFARWMRILAAVPDSVLWLLASGAKEAMRENLAREAAAAGIAPARIIHLAKLPHDQYLTRYEHVDLFLDTEPYGAHTTASDALWAGCPVLTLPGETFASRVGGSLLTALGVADELVASDAADYERRAIALGRDTNARASLRARVAAAARTSPLFDLKRFAADFTRAIEHMLARQRRGEAPADLDLSP